MAEVVEGIADGCRQSGCALLGGETAEMPGFYGPGRYDLAGFCVAVVEEDERIDGRAVQAGDRIVAVASSGVHSNGFSLVRRILEMDHVDPDTRLPQTGEPLIDSPAETHPSLRIPGDRPAAGGVCHCTAWPTSPAAACPRICPAACPTGSMPVIEADSWDRPALFRWLQEQRRGARSRPLEHLQSRGRFLPGGAPGSHGRCSRPAGPRATRPGELGQVRQARHRRRHPLAGLPY